MCTSKDDESRQIESLGFTEMEVQEFEEQVALDKELKVFILKDQAESKRVIPKNEGFMECDIETEDSYRISREEQGYAEY